MVTVLFLFFLTDIFADINIFIDSNLSLPAEKSLASQIRQAHPEQSLVWDGEQTVYIHFPGENLYPWDPDLLWPSNSGYPNIPHNFSPSTQWQFHALGGNEVGDAHLQELAYPDNSFKENHTPYLDLQVSNQNQNFSWATGFLQNDHSSFQKMDYRLNRLGQKTIGESIKERDAYFGGNYPPRSTLYMASAIRTHSVQASGQIFHGYLWTPSLLTGQEYPWAGGQGKFDFQHKYWGSTAFFNAWSSLSIADPNATWNDKNIELWIGNTKYAPKLTHTNPPINTEYNATAGLWDRSIRNSTVLMTNESHLYTQASIVQPIIASSRFHNWSAISGMYRLNTWGGVFSNHTLYTPRPNLNNYLSLSLQRGDGGFHLVSITETNASDTAQKSVWLPNHDLLSGLIHTKIDHTNPWGKFSLTGSFGIEDNNQHLQTDSIYTSSNALLRNAHIKKTRGIITGLQRTVAYQLPIKNKLSATVLLGWQNSWATQNSQITEKPSTYWLSMEFSKTTPTHLAIKSVISCYSARQISGWGNSTFDASPNSLNTEYDTPFRIAPSFTWNLSLRQVLFNNHLSLHYTGLHLFNDEVVEHPAGNPLRFRILIGLDAIF